MKTRDTIKGLRAALANVQGQLAMALEEVRGRTSVISSLECDCHRLREKVADQDNLLGNRGRSYDDLLRTYQWEQKCRAKRIAKVQRALLAVVVDVTSEGPAKGLGEKRIANLLGQALQEAVDMEVYEWPCTS
jgi:hypothetical protein